MMALKEFQLPSNMSTDIKQPESSNIDLVTSYIWLYNYCGVTNIIGQYALPREEEPESPTYDRLKIFVDRSHEDFLLLNNILQQVNPTVIHSCSSAQHLLQEAEDIRELVKSTEEFYVELKKLEK